MDFDEEEVTDEPLDCGDESHCDRCDKTKMKMWHRWSDVLGDVWLCEDCKNNFDKQDC
jgi:ribosomal protein L37AE/L43A